MSEETLFTAARRMMRFVRIDESHGGLLSEQTIIANETLARMVEKEERRQKDELKDRTEGM